MEFSQPIPRPASEDRQSGAVQASCGRPSVRRRKNRILHNGDLQTALGRYIPRQDRIVTVGEQGIVIDGGLDRSGADPGRPVRLLGYYTPAIGGGISSPDSKGLVMTLHGWEGSSHSAYNLILGSALVRAGYDVLRLNLRDHGPTHHLNRGIFYATLIEEVHAAAQQVGCLAAGRPFYVVGASLGGNFAVRIALRHARYPVPDLRRAIGINPVLNPRRTCTLLDRHWFLRPYFRSRWLASLRAKQAAFPDLYEFSPLEDILTINEMSNWLFQRYGPYANVDEYLQAYGVPPAAMHDLSVPVSILSAANDPVIPPIDITALPAHSLLQVHLLPFGGHVGYTDLFPLRSRLAELVLPLLEQG